MDEIKEQHQQDNYKGDPYGDQSFDSGKKNSSITIIATHVFKVIALKSFYELSYSIMIPTSIIQEKQGTTPCLKFTMRSHIHFNEYIKCNFFQYSKRLGDNHELIYAFQREDLVPWSNATKLISNQRNRTARHLNALVTAQ